MSKTLSYPYIITPSTSAAQKTDTNGKTYYSFKADLTTAAGKNRGEMRVQAFGPIVARLKGILRKGRPAQLRVVFTELPPLEGHSRGATVAKIVGITEAAANDNAAAKKAA